MHRLLWVAVGGALGAVLRYLVVAGLQRRVPEAFPWGTLAVNLSGCFAIGFLAVASASWLGWREEHRLALVVGVLGGFTTFSAFAWETVALAEAGRGVGAAANALGSTVLCCLLAWAGAWLAHRWVAAG